MTETILTSFDFSSARKVGKSKYRKQILPIGSINYKGRKITFDRRFLMDLANSFKQQAYPQVPFQLATPQNEHNMDPELYRGEITDLLLTNDGLDAVVELTARGSALVEENPKLGVSARIVQGLEKSDGRKFGRAIQHVLATMDPRVTGLRPWQAVDLSEKYTSEVVDLTAETYEGNTKMPKKTGFKVGSVDSKAKTATIDLSAFTDEEFSKFVLDLADEGEVEIDPATGKPKVKDDEVDPDEIEDPEGDGEEDDGTIVDPNQPAPAAQAPAPASGRPVKRKTTVEESTVEPMDAVTNLSNQFSDFIAKGAKKEWASRRELMETKGVPPFILDLAEPLMSSPDTFSIDLSATDGGTVDPKDIVNKMLDAYTGAIDLAPEMGHSIDLSDVGQKDDPDQALLDVWSETYGG